MGRTSTSADSPSGDRGRGRILRARPGLAGLNRWGRRLGGSLTLGRFGAGVAKIGGEAFMPFLATPAPNLAWRHAVGQGWVSRGWMHVEAGRSPLARRDGCRAVA